MKLILLLSLTLTSLSSFSQADESYEISIPLQYIRDANECFDEYGEDLLKRTQISRIKKLDFDNGVIEYEPISKVKVEQDKVFKNLFNITGENYKDSFSFIMVADYCYIARKVRQSDVRVTLEYVYEAEAMWDGDNILGYIVNDPDHSLASDKEEATYDEIVLK